VNARTRREREQAVIWNQWYVVLEAREVPRHRPIGVTRMGEKLVFWRDQAGRVVCQRDLCPHRGVALSAGKIVEGCIQCPFHGFKYDASGRCRLIPASGKNARPPEAFRVHTYPACEAHGFIYIFWGEPREPLPPVPFFDDIGDDFTYSWARDPWPTHYSRAIENQLDVVHLPFVHHNTIGRGGRTVVDGPISRWMTENHLRVYVYNRIDDGVPPRKPRELNEPASNFWVEVLFPNLWQNHLGDDSRIVVAFVPVDDEHSLLYLHFYQRFVRLPILAGLVNRLAMPMNLLILHQDRRVVLTQRPLRTWLHMGEKLIQGDGPIIEYRRRREALIAANAGGPES
jgi:phenylpropionate dioxygenase-like ring-hydroxylating dioxygenase large terminal subunit